jgi:hypothetical protein
MLLSDQLLPLLVTMQCLSKDGSSFLSVASNCCTVSKALYNLLFLQMLICNNLSSAIVQLNFPYPSSLLDSSLAILYTRLYLECFLISRYLFLPIPSQIDSSSILYSDDLKLLLLNLMHFNCTIFLYHSLYPFYIYIYYLLFYNLFYFFL